MYAIVKTGGKQYRVEQGQSLLVERLPAAAEGETVALDPLLVVDGSDLVDGDELSRASVSARVVGHERGPKLRVVKFKPKRGYKRRTGHRQELTRLEVTEVKLGSGRSRGGAGKAAAAGGGAAAGAAGASEKPAGAGAAEKPRGAGAEKPKGAAAGADAAAEKPKGAGAAEKPRPRTRKAPAKKEADDGS